MTTTVTLKTHGWPVDVTTTDTYSRTLTTSIETVAPNTERDFYLSETRVVAFTELALPDTELPGDPD